MLGKLIPILLALVGLGAGVGAGVALRPEPQKPMMENPCGDVAHTEEEHKEPTTSNEDEDTQDPSQYDYVKLNNQFVVPIVKDSRVESLVVVSLSLEVALGSAEDVYRIEPKLRDEFLQVMFGHANAGGFSGTFTEVDRMRILRRSLMDAGKKLLGDTLSDVLIIDVVRQDATN